MKKILFLMLCITSMSFAIPRSIYLVNAQDNGSSFTLAITKPNQTTIAQLGMKSFSITMPQEGQNGIFSVQLEKTSPHDLKAFGAYKGSFTFSKGAVLPQVPNGVYTFILNGAEFGQLTVEADNVIFRYIDADQLVFPQDFQ